MKFIILIFLFLPNLSHAKCSIVFLNQSASSSGNSIHDSHTSEYLRRLDFLVQRGVVDADRLREILKQDHVQNPLSSGKHIPSTHIPIQNAFDRLIIKGLNKNKIDLFIKKKIADLEKRDQVRNERKVETESVLYPELLWSTEKGQFSSLDIVPFAKGGKDYLAMVAANGEIYVLDLMTGKEIQRIQTDAVWLEDSLKIAELKSGVMLGVIEEMTGTTTSRNLLFLNLLEGKVIDRIMIKGTDSEEIQIHEKGGKQYLWIKSRDWGVRHPAVEIIDLETVGLQKFKHDFIPLDKKFQNKNKNKFNIDSILKLFKMEQNVYGVANISWSETGANKKGIAIIDPLKKKVLYEIPLNLAFKPKMTKVFHYKGQLFLLLISESGESVTLNVKTKKLIRTNLPFDYGHMLFQNTLNIFETKDELYAIARTRPDKGVLFKPLVDGTIEKGKYFQTFDLPMSEEYNLMHSSFVFDALGGHYLVGPTATISNRSSGFFVVPLDFENNMALGNIIQHQFSEYGRRLFIPYRKGNDVHMISLLANKIETFQLLGPQRQKGKVLK